MTKEQEMALIDKSAMAIANILQHEDLFPYWGSILEEARGAMNEYVSKNEDLFTKQNEYQGEYGSQFR